jgi:hypothetical protein
MRDDLTRRLWIEVNRYLKLEVGGKKITAPYYTNYVATKTRKSLLEYGLTESQSRDYFKIYNSNSDLYGLYRGKGTPEQLVMGINRIAEDKKVDLEKASGKGILMMMYDFGLGVDCSGFVFNVLFSVVGQRLVEGLDWGQDSRHDVNRAGAFTFAGKASEVVDVNDVGGGDVIVLRNGADVTHVALIVESEDKLYVAQSTSTLWPMGVHVNEFFVAGGGIKFDFKPDWGVSWEEKFAKGELEFRRLKL